MTNKPYENRPLTSDELAFMVKILRKTKEWTQDTLSELSKLSIKTIHRVEKGLPSDNDTRRAIARAFEFEDINIFNDYPVSDLIKVIEELEKIEKETIEVSLEVIKRGKQLREYVEHTEAYSFQELIFLSLQADAVFSEMKDYIMEYDMAHEFYSETEKLGVNIDFQDMVDKLKTMGFLIGVGIRKGGGDFLENICIFIGYENNFPDTIRMAKAVEYK